MKSLLHLSQTNQPNRFKLARQTIFLERFTPSTSSYFWVDLSISRNPSLHLSVILVHPRNNPQRLQQIQSYLLFNLRSKLGSRQLKSQSGSNCGARGGHQSALEHSTKDHAGPEGQNDGQKVEAQGFRDNPAVDEQGRNERQSVLRRNGNPSTLMREVFGKPKRSDARHTKKG